MSFETVKRNYDRGLWNSTMVKMAVRKGVITPAQYKEITGQAYELINPPVEESGQ